MDNKRKYFGVSLIGLMGLFFIITTAFAEVSVKDANDWLSSKATAAPKVDLTGKWDAGSAWNGGWGEGNFFQEKASFNGSLGMYNVKGVVSGTDLYLVLTSNDWVYYTAKMSRQSDGSFTGKATKETLVDSKAAESAETWVITFSKM